MIIYKRLLFALLAGEEMILRYRYKIVKIPTVKNGVYKLNGNLEEKQKYRHNKLNSDIDVSFFFSEKVKDFAHI